MDSTCIILHLPEVGKVRSSLPHGPKGPFAPFGTSTENSRFCGLLWQKNPFLQTMPPTPLDDIKSMFASISPTYDRLNAWFSLGLDRSWRQEIRKALPFRGGEILDCCTGTGELALLLASKGYHVTGIDVCEPMLAQARKKVPQGTPLEFVEADVYKLPFPDRSFHAVTNAFSLRNLFNLRQVFRETHRVLAPSGVALFLDLTRPKRWLRPFHQLYLQRFIPFIGGLVSGNRKAYAYLAHSILSFHSKEEIRDLLLEGSFRHVEIRPLSSGIATLWMAVK